MASRANLKFGMPAFNLSSSAGKQTKKRAPATADGTNAAISASPELDSLQGHSRNPSIISNQSLTTGEQLSNASADSLSLSTLTTGPDAGEKAPSVVGSGSVSTRSSGVSLSDVSAFNRAEGGGRAQTVGQTQGPGPAAGGTDESATSTPAAVVPGGGPGMKLLPRKSSLRNRSQIPTMASVSEQQEEREHSESTLFSLSSLFPDVALAYRSSLSR